MGNASAREKGRHSSGEDSGPTMAVRDFMSGSLEESEECMQGSTVSTHFMSSFYCVTRIYIYVYIYIYLFIYSFIL